MQRIDALLFYGALPLAIILVVLVVVLCLLKGDVKAGFKIPFVAFAFEAKERRRERTKVQRLIK